MVFWYFLTVWASPLPFSLSLFGLFPSTTDCATAERVSHLLPHTRWLWHTREQQKWTLFQFSLCCSVSVSNKDDYWLGQNQHKGMWIKRDFVYSWFLSCSMEPKFEPLFVVVAEEIWYKFNEISLKWICWPASSWTASYLSVLVWSHLHFFKNEADLCATVSPQGCSRLRPYNSQPAVCRIKSPEESAQMSGWHHVFERITINVMWHGQGLYTKAKIQGLPHCFITVKQKSYRGNKSRTQDGNIQLNSYLKKNTKNTQTHTNKGKQ